MERWDLSSGNVGYGGNLVFKLFVVFANDKRKDSDNSNGKRQLDEAKLAARIAAIGRIAVPICVFVYGDWVVVSAIKCVALVEPPVTGVAISRTEIVHRQVRIELLAAIAETGVVGVS